MTSNATGTKSKRRPMYQCQECGKVYYSTTAARRAAWDGCAKCGGTDIDLYVGKR